MPELAMSLPARRTDLLIKPIGDEGRYVVKDPRSGEFFQLGENEHFLLTRLNGERTADEICKAYAQQCGEPLCKADFDEFVALARSQNLLQSANGDASALQGHSEVTQPSSAARQSIFHWRKNVWDPDRFFTWLALRIWFFWTPAFVLVSAGCIVLAAFLVWTNRQDLAGSFDFALRWQTAILVWLTLAVVTTLHECAHGLTCKHHGGEVHEVGFLLMFFMPCFYCNVSDAWLFKEKSKRLWVSFAGGYFELFVWALAVFIWRLTVPGTFPSYLAFIVLTACGIQTLFNFIPFLKLDGYYLLSDWLEIPNLQQKALGSFKGRLRWLLWGASRPPTEPRGKLLWRFGLASWVFSLGFLALSLATLAHLAGAIVGWAGLVVVALLGLIGLRGIFRGFSGGEVTKMIFARRKRTAVWFLVFSALAVVLAAVPIEDRAGGEFQVRSRVRAEVRAEVSGFIREVQFEEGDRVSPGALLVRLEAPDLAGRTAQNRAEIQKAQARLQLLEQLVVEQRRRVERARAWSDLARTDLARVERSQKEDLTRIDRQTDQAQAELNAAQAAHQRARALSEKRNGSEEDRQEAERRLRVSQAMLAQFQAERRSREAKGAIEAKTELDRREKDMVDASAALDLLESPTHEQEIAAEMAHLESLREEKRYLESLQSKLSICSPVPGVVTTPRLKEKIGQFVREGDLICLIEEPGTLEAEIALSEQDVAHLRVGQAVDLKARALPFETFSGRVERIAPAAGKGEGQNTVIVYCRLDNAGDLRPGMTGHARIYTGGRSIGGFLSYRAMRYLRTEFWW